MHGRTEARALAAALAIAIVLSAVVAWPAAANFGGVFPTDEDGGTAIETISTAQNLFAFVQTDVQGGDICVVPAALENPGDGSLNCLTPAWGSSNRVVGIGSRWTLIETPYLRAGHWKLLGDGGSRQSVDVFSNDFWVVPCEPGACDRRLAQETAASYKAAAGQMATAMGGMKQTLKLMTKLAPEEPFDKFKNALNTVVKDSLEDAPAYKRVIADKVTRKLKFATRIPSGPHAMALSIAHQVNSDALEMYLDIVNDPPAPYDTVAQPEFGVPALSAGDAQIDGLMLDLAQLAGYGAAGRKAFERYTQAAADDSDVGVHRQAAALGRFNGRLAAEMWSAAVGLDAWAAKLEADPEWAGATVVQEHVDDLLPFIHRVRSSGLDTDERQGFADAGLDDEAIAKLTSELTADDLDEVRVGVPIQDLVREVAADMREQAPVFDAMAREAEAVAQSTDSPPVASFDATPISGAPPLQVTFRDTSVHPDDEPLTVRWNFGDGSPEAEGVQVSHTFDAGTHLVTQTVSDGVTTSTATRTIVATPPNGAPVARITRTPAEGVAPLSVAFDGSTSSDDGAILAYDWDFGDGATARTPAATHVYRAPGTYTAKLTVTDDGGVTGASTATVVVREAPPNQPPVPGADQIATRQDTPRTFDVLANDSDPEGGALKVVGTGAAAHGTASCTEQGSCTYTPGAGYSGTDAFTYAVEDAEGARATGHVSVTVSAVNRPPVADAGADQEAGEDDAVGFDGRGSSDPDGSVATYTWDFGDGSDPQTTTSPQTSHAYGRNGTYTVRLVVTDGDGATGEDTAIVRVANRPPQVSVTTYPRAPVGAVRPYKAFVGTGSAEPTTVAADFGDGTAPVEREITGSAWPSFDHAYAGAGLYNVTFTVIDSAGESATASGTVLVEDAVAAAGPDIEAEEGAEVTLGGPSTRPDEHTSVTWDFGDGSPEAQGVEQKHVYRDDGVYTASVTVKDDAATVTDEVRVTVANVAPDPGLTVAGGAAPGRAVAMRGFATDPGRDDELTYAWKFGDGAVATGRRVSHAYGAAGTYTVELRVADGDGGTATASRTVVVGGPQGRRDSRGGDFWLSFPTNFSEAPALTLFVAAETATTGSVEIPGLGWTDGFSVTPGGVTAVTLPPAAQLDRSANGVQDLGIHVSAGADVSVYGLNRIKFTTDAFVGLPTDALGTEYRVISYDPSSGTGPEASVVATGDDTLVTITPSVDVPGHPAGAPFEVALDMGEAFQLRSDEDLTGTRIVANRPVAAFGAHNCANVPQSVTYCDHLLEQLTPVDTWGRSFATMPLATRSGGDTFRILAAEAGTAVKVNGATVATLAAGAHYEQLVDGPATIEASKPVMVAQYSNGSSFDSTVSDPFMTIVPPSEQFQAAYTVSTPAEGFARNFLNLVVPAAAKAAVRIDGDAVPEGAFKTIGASGYVGAQVEVGLGSHRVTSSAPFGVTVYGYDRDDSYGYGGGMALAEVASVTQLRLTPEAETLDTGTDGCVEATSTDAAGAPIADLRVDFEVSGPNSGGGFATTDAGGVARHCWRGARVGEDTATASIGALSRTATKRWRPPNRPPAAADDVASTPEDRAVGIAVAELLGNDTDPDADPLSVTGVSGAVHGRVELAGGRAVFTPDADFDGLAGFRYEIADGRGGTASAAVRITVEPIAGPAPPHDEPGEDRQEVKAETAEDLVFDCTERMVVLEDVVPAGSKVRLVGVADRRFAGRTVSVVFVPSGKVVARPKVAADGSFSATAPMPPKQVRNTNLARYEARIGAERSLKLKLARRMRITSIGVSGGKVVVTGTVAGPLAARKADRAIELQRRVSCTRSEPVAKTMPRPNGTFRMAVAVPSGASAAVYRLRTKVRPSASSDKAVNTFTLPRGVDF